jgi:hypothetical protein
MAAGCRMSMAAPQVFCKKGKLINSRKNLQTMFIKIQETKKKIKISI